MASGQDGSPAECGSRRSISKDGDRTSTQRRPADPAEPGKADPAKTEEIGGPKGPEPTRYGDWEKGGRCSDF